MSYLLVAMILCAMTLCVAAALRLSLFSPPVITSAVWLFVFAAGTAFQGQFYPITDEAFVAWLVWYGPLGVALLFFTPSGPGKFRANPTRELPVDYSWLLVALIIWLGYRIWVIGSGGPGHFFFNLRLPMSGVDAEEVESLGALSHFYPLVFALFLFEHINFGEHNRRRRVLCWLWLLGYAIATMGKMSLLTPLVAWGVINGASRELRRSTLVKVAAISLIAMLALHFARQGENGDASLADMLAVYIYSPIVAFGYLDPPRSDQEGQYVFRFVYAVGNKLGVLPPPADVLFDYSYVPMPTNVYTVLHPFALDYGLVGVALGSMLYAAFFGLLYFFARRNGGFALGLYAALFIALVVQTFSEIALIYLSMHLQVAIALALIYYISRRRSNVGRYIDGHAQRGTVPA